MDAEGRKRARQLAPGLVIGGLLIGINRGWRVFQLLEHESVDWFSPGLLINLAWVTFCAVAFVSGIILFFYSFGKRQSQQESETSP